MRKSPLAKAKAHFSELVDAVEHRGARILILRRGKPAAALVPHQMAYVATEAPRKPSRMTKKQLARFWARFGKGDAARSAVRDLIQGRLRVDRYR